VRVGRERELMEEGQDLSQIIRRRENRYIEKDRKYNM
jgi:hypothetical protein